MQKMIEKYWGTRSLTGLENLASQKGINGIN